MYVKHFYATVNYLPIYLLFHVFYWIVAWLVGWLYPPLSELLPTVFPTYNKIFEREAYELLEANKSLFSALITLAAMNFFAVLYDGRRYEETVSRTNGLFNIKDELLPYCSRTLIPDLIASAALQIPFLVLYTVPLPKQISRFISPLLLPHAVIIEPYGIAAAYLIILSTAAAVRLLCAPIVLKKHRAIWITAFAEEAEI